MIVMQITKELSTLIYPAHVEDVRVNLESITFLKVRKIMYLDKAYIIKKRNV